MPDAQQLHAKLVEGVTHQQAGNLVDAQAAYRFVLKHDPRNFDALHLLGVIAAQTKDFAESVKLISRALTVNPANAAAHYNRGIALEELQQYDAAVAAYDKCIKLQPDHAVACNNRGIALAALRRLPEAVASYTQAITLRPDYADALHNRGHALSDLGDHTAALADFDAALRLKPDYPFLPGVRLYTKLRMCDWRNLSAEVADIERSLAGNAAVTTPWPALVMTDAPALQRKAIALWAHATQPPNPVLGPFAKRARRGKIRVGYFSMDFRAHPVAELLARLIEKHDRAAFEIYAFSYGPDTKDAMRQRLRGAFDTFIDVREKSDPEIAALARKAEIDIAVDLAGYTTGARPGILAARAAPIQVSYLGFPGTLAAPYMDYIVADETAIPPDARGHYTEKVVYLPCFQANDDTRAVPSITFSRAELGLPAEGMVFCCFNNSYKFSPAMFAAWMRILNRVVGSVLFIYADSEIAAANLRQAAATHGVDPARLVFGKRLDMAGYLARYKAADLFLDTLPYNAGTTATDALWMGLPVLTCMGGAFASRMAASLLRTLDLPEMITTNLQDYEDRAVALATDAAQLAAVREKLVRNRETGALYDTARFARHLEAAYTQMIARHDAGAPPDHLTIT